MFRAWYRFDKDVSDVFPFLYAKAERVRRNRSLPHASFYWNGKECMLRQQWAAAGFFEDRERAKSFGRQFVKLLNQIYASRQTIPPMDKADPQPSVLDILRILPRNNCKRCNRTTCTAFAADLAQGMARPWDCPFFPSPHRGRFDFRIPGSNTASSFAVDVNLDKTSRDQPFISTMNLKPTSGTLCGLPRLTKREKQVLELVASGFANPEIADRLYISPHTVKSHVSNIFEKLDATDRVQASVKAVRLGLIK